MRMRSCVAITVPESPPFRTVPPGTVRFNATNVGEDAHDLAVVTGRGTVLAASDEIRSNRQAGAFRRVQLVR
jgi:hypothetical protein